MQFIKKKKLDMDIGNELYHYHQISNSNTILVGRDKTIFN